MPKILNDNPAVVAPPPLIFLAGLILGLAVHWFYPFTVVPVSYLNFARILGVLLAAAGLAIIFVARAGMKRVNTNIEPWKPTNAILTGGIYSVSRNPVYLAMVAIFIGIYFIFNSIWFLAVLVPLLAVMHLGVISREERYLESKFGDQYLRYKNKVRRWI